jgi:hypothetical protein
MRIESLVADVGHGDSGNPFAQELLAVTQDAIVGHERFWPELPPK